MSQLVAECVSHIQAHQQLLCLKHEHHLGKPLYKKSAVQTEIRRKEGGLKTHSKWNVGVLQ